MEIINIGLIAGHGQHDPGATTEKYQEYYLNRQVISELKQRESDVINYILYDTNLSLSNSKDAYQRGDILEWAKKNNITHIIEWHHNKFNNKAEGTEVLTEVDNYDDLDYNLRVANSKLFTDRGFKDGTNLANYKRLYNSGISYRLVEVCFLDNSTDMYNWDMYFDEVINNYHNAILKSFDINQPKNEDDKTEDKKNIEFSKMISAPSDMSGYYAVTTLKKVQLYNYANLTGKGKTIDEGITVLAKHHKGNVYRIYGKEIFFKDDNAKQY